jgi:hypothetical protein
MITNTKPSVPAGPTMAPILLKRFRAAIRNETGIEQARVPVAIAAEE